MPTTAECEAIRAIIKKLGGQASSKEISKLLNERIEVVSRHIRSMRKFGYVQVKCPDKYRGHVYELKG